jgi:hypothetical protein
MVLTIEDNPSRRFATVPLERAIAMFVQVT